MKRPRETYRAATPERTGEVREMRIRNDPENARTCQLIQILPICLFCSLAFANTEIISIQAARPCGNSNVSIPVK